MTSIRLVAVALALLFATCASAATDHDKNQDIYDALSAAGLNRAVVDVTQERALISFEHQPLQSDNGVDVAWFYIMGAAARSAPGSKEIVIITSSHGEPIMKATVKTSDVIDYEQKRIDAKTLQGRVRVESEMASSRRCGDNMAYQDGKCECIPGFREDGGKCAIESGSGGAWCLLGGIGLTAAAGALTVLLAVAGLVIWRMRRK